MENLLDIRWQPANKNPVNQKNYTNINIYLRMNSKNNNYPEPVIYPSTVAARRNGRFVKALVPSAVGETRARTNEEIKTAVQINTSALENGEGFAMGSAGIISVFTMFLTVNAVYAATQREANQPPTGE